MDLSVRRTVAVQQNDPGLVVLIDLFLARLRTTDVAPSLLMGDAQPLRTDEVNRYSRSMVARKSRLECRARPSCKRRSSA